MSVILNESNLSKYRIRGIVKFANIGNTCYLNSALQALLANNILTCYFSNKKFIKQLEKNIVNKLVKEKQKKEPGAKIAVSNTEIIDTIKNTISYEYYRIVKNVMTKVCKIIPQSFKKKVGEINSSFVGFNQNDCAEILGTILDTLHDELKESSIIECKMSDLLLQFKSKYEYLEKKEKILNEMKQDEYKTVVTQMKKNILNEKILLIKTQYNNYINYLSFESIREHHKVGSSIVSDIHGGYTYIETICCECNTPSVRFENFTMITLPLPNETSTLTKCLDNYFSISLLTGDNKYNCSKCGVKRDAIQRSYIWSLPEKLIIHFKRFEISVSLYGTMSATKKNYLIDFTLSNLNMKKYISVHNKSLNDYNYNLYSVVYHQGALNMGHYFTKGKNFINNEWYLYNDDHISPILTDDIVNKDAYIVIYEKIHTPKIVI